MNQTNVISFGATGVSKTALVLVALHVLLESLLSKLMKQLMSRFKSLDSVRRRTVPATSRTF